MKDWQWIVCAMLLGFVCACGAEAGLTDLQQSIEESSNASGSTLAGNPTDALTVDLKGARGLALTEAASTTPGVKGADAPGVSNLKRINADHSLTDAVVAGTVTVQSVVVAPGNQVYLLLSSPLDSCILLQVDGNTNAVSCVDQTLASVTSSNAFGDPIQFDDAGHIYYQGNTADGKTILRERTPDATTDLMNDHIALAGFVVLPNGTLFVSGHTIPTGTAWTRMIAPDRSVHHIVSTQADFLARFPDENVYFSTNTGVGRYLLATRTVDPLLWISEDGNGAYYACPVAHSACHTARAFAQTINGRIYTTVPNVEGQRALVQYYPQPSLVTSVVTDVAVMKVNMDSLLLAGLRQDNLYTLVLHETAAGTETHLLGTEEIEVYHLDYLQDDTHQIVVFDGLRFSDNSYVLCQIDITTKNSLACAKTNLGKLADIQLFDAK